MRLAGPVLLAALAAAVPASAQVLPDTTWAPTVESPEFPPGKGPVVVVDATHRELHTLDRSFAPFGALLAADGFEVVPGEGPLEAELRRADVLVVANARKARGAEGPSAFTDAETREIDAWVRRGGSLLLIADHMPFAGAAASLADRFGIELVNGFALDREASDSRTVYSRENGLLASDAIADGGAPGELVDRVVTFAGSALRPRSEKVRPLLYLPPDYVVFLPAEPWKFGPDTRRIPTDGLLQAAVVERGKGRVAVVGEAAMFTAQVFGPDRVPLGMNAPGAEENPRFVLNLLHWLVGRLQ